MTPARLLAPDPQHRVPYNYDIYSRDIQLPGGGRETIYSVVRKECPAPDPDEAAMVHEAIREGFIWALTTDYFYDIHSGEHMQPEPDDRALEIGNMCSYGMMNGLDEAALRVC